jgi:hypothetical protein
MDGEVQDKMEEFITGYCDAVRAGLRERWSNYKPEIYNNETSEAIGGLVARQATLAIEFATNPGIWNGHIAPLVLRCMTDTHITLAWILESPLERSREYIRFGLGQEKLFIEYLENEAEQAPADELDERIEEMIEVRKNWLSSQLMEWAIEVNVGSWSGKSTRDMAIEAGCEGLYKFAYVPFSGPAHSMWQHVGIYNVVRCENPLHKNHRIPAMPELRIDPDFLYRSAKYVSRTYDLLSGKLGLRCDTMLPVAYFAERHPFRPGDESAGS